MTSEIDCTTTSVTLTEPTPDTGIYESIQAVQKSLSTTYFEMPVFTSSNPTCPISKYEVIKDTTNSLHSSLVTTPTISGTLLRIKPSNTGNVVEHKFRIRATMTGTDGDLILVSANPYTLRVGCGSWETLTMASTFVLSGTVTAEVTHPLDKYNIVPRVMYPTFCVPTKYTLSNVLPAKTGGSPAGAWYTATT